MSFPRYPEYKPSGVEWLGDVPEHWQVRRIKEVCRFFGGGTPARDNPKFWNGGIPWVSPKDMKVELLRFTQESITNEGVAASATTLLEPGHVLIVVRSGILQHTIPVAINDVSVAVNQDIRALRFNRSLCDPSYFLRWVQGLNDRLLVAWSKQGATVESLEHELIANSAILSPPQAERSAIALFLDRETAKIDALVAEQQRLIELLKEKRQAVISHAVTKGLDPKAPMKPSGVEWLGDVPAQWRWGRLRFLAAMIVDGTHHSPESFPTGDRLYVTAKNIKEEGVDLSDVSFIPEAVHEEIFARCPVSVGDVLYIKDGATAGIATVNRLAEPFSLLSSVAVIRTCQDLLDAEYLKHLLNGSFKQDALNRVVGGAMTRLTLDMISRFVVSLPPLAEQRAITAFLDRETAKIDGLIAEAESAITFLQERRSALISAAVTGQIDVRNTVASEAA